MFRHCFSIFWLMAVSILWCSTGVFGKIDLNPRGFPAARTRTYSDPSKRTRIYRVQEPEERRDHPNILIYMHGSAGKEEQGMDLLWERGTFARLRNLMNRWGWIYVCPRDAEFVGLLKHLEEKYAPQAIYLAGASGGGNVVLWEAGRNPSAYAGLLLLCPAIQRGKKSYPGTLSMPVWIVSGEKDRKITRQCRALVKQLKSLQRSYFYREIPGGITAPRWRRLRGNKLWNFSRGIGGKSLPACRKLPGSGKQIESASVHQIGAKFTDSFISPPKSSTVISKACFSWGDAPEASQYGMPCFPLYLLTGSC